MSRATIALILAVTSVLGGISAEQAKDGNEKARILRLFNDEFVALTPGQGKFPLSFHMGTADEGLKSEKPAHGVTFKYSFAVAKHEVTQELFEAVMGRNPSKWQGKRNAVEMVTWDGADEFCTKVTAELKQRKLLAADQVIRLPSEAEWEYACRAGTKTAYSFGDLVSELGDYAWFTGNAAGNDPPVGKKKPNPWGLYDMHGYVWEWCQDAWHNDYKGAPTDGSAWTLKNAKTFVVRGGSWRIAPSCRSAHRQVCARDQRSDALGFRCVRANVSEGKK